MNVGVVLALGLSRLGLDAAAPGGFAQWGGRMTGLLAEVFVPAYPVLAVRTVRGGGGEVRVVTVPDIVE